MVVLLPAHMDVPPVAVTLGKGFTVTVTVAILVQPLASWPVTV
jgi:uncharacterized membrane protein YqaE (UPF0057 family)